MKIVTLKLSYLFSFFVSLGGGAPPSSSCSKTWLSLCSCFLVFDFSFIFCHVIYVPFYIAFLHLTDCHIHLSFPSSFRNSDYYFFFYHNLSHTSFYSQFSIKFIITYKFFFIFNSISIIFLVFLHLLSFYLHMSLSIIFSYSFNFSHILAFAFLLSRFLAFCLL